METESWKEQRDGSVRIELAPGIAATFEIDTDDGWVDVDLPDAKTQPRRHGSVLGTTGPEETEGRIRVRTSDGNVELMEA